jgi:preprotein translocase subunit SecG
MATFLLIIHLLVCFFLIFIVLIQSGKGAELGAAFGGSSQTMFGARGAATFFSKMTTIAAIVFMLTSLSLAVLSVKGGSVVKKAPVAAEQKGIPQIPQGTGPVKADHTAQPSQPAGQGSPQLPVKPAK